MSMEKTVLNVLWFVIMWGNFILFRFSLVFRFIFYYFLLFNRTFLQITMHHLCTKNNSQDIFDFIVIHWKNTLISYHVLVLVNVALHPFILIFCEHSEK